MSTEPPRAATGALSPAAPSPVTAQVAAGFDSLPALEREWRALFDSLPAEPAMSFEWTQALVRTQLNPSDECRVVTLRRGERLVGLVPMIVRATRVFKQRHFVLRPLAELKNTHSDLLMERAPEVVSAFFGALRGLECRWDSLRLSKLLYGHVMTPLLEEQAIALGYTPHLRFRKAAYWIRLPGSFDEYFAARSSKFRNHARRAEKKLRAAGRVSVVEIAAAEQFEDGYDALLQVERRSWKEPYGTSMSAVPSQAALYREWGRAAAATGNLHLQLLMLDGEPIAHNLGCVHRGTYYYLKSSYSASHRPLSPATFLRLALIDSMIARGVTEIDFCGTPYEWEQQWTNAYRWHRVLSVYAPTWRGRILSLLDRWTHYSSSGLAIEHEDPRNEKPSTA